VKSLSPLIAGPPEGRTATKSVSVVEIRDPRTQQSLVVESDETLSGYEIDVIAAGWKEGERHPDGVLVATLDGTDWVVFVELKGTLKERRKQQPPADHALDQLEGAVSHFHPTGRGSPDPSHGATHHDRWADGIDALAVRPGRNHRVIGVALAFHEVPRPAPSRPIPFGPIEVPLRISPVHKTGPNQTTLTLRRLLQLAGERV
jgi:hypothetical protein